MKNRYNIALLPVSKASEFIRLSRSLSHLAGEYRLGLASLPHITLCQFMAEETELAAIWKNICAAGIPSSIRLTLKEFSSKAVDGASWLSLRADNLDALMKMHRTVANLVEERLGRCFENYDAHLTLVNIREGIVKDSVPFAYMPIQDVFILSLGKSDDLGQFKELIYSCQ